MSQELPGSKSLTLWIHCGCGTSLVGTTSSPEMADALMQLFHQRHCGEGHFPVSPPEQATVAAEQSIRHRSDFPKAGEIGGL